MESSVFEHAWLVSQRKSHYAMHSQYDDENDDNDEDTRMEESNEDDNGLRPDTGSACIACIRHQASQSASQSDSRACTWGVGL